MNTRADLWPLSTSYSGNIYLSAPFAAGVNLNLGVVPSEAPDPKDASAFVSAFEHIPFLENKAVAEISGFTSISSTLSPSSLANVNDLEKLLETYELDCEIVIRQSHARWGLAIDNFERFVVLGVDESIAERIIAATGGFEQYRTVVWNSLEAARITHPVLTRESIPYYHPHI